MVHGGIGPEVVAARAQVLPHAYEAHPERFVNQPPDSGALATEVWINPPPRLVESSRDEFRRQECPVRVSMTHVPPNRRPTAPVRCSPSKRYCPERLTAFARDPHDAGAGALEGHD